MVYDLILIEIIYGKSRSNRMFGIEQKVQNACETIQQIIRLEMTNQFIDPSFHHKSLLENLI